MSDAVCLKGVYMYPVTHVEGDMVNTFLIN
jgi:hypothetical protein